MQSEQEHREELAKIFKRAKTISKAMGIEQIEFRNMGGPIQVIFIFEKIKKLISEDNIDMSIEFLRILLADRPKFDELVITSARYNDLKRQIRINTINWENQNIEKNKIRKSILEIISDLEVDLSNEKFIFDDEDSQDSNSTTAKALLSAGKQLYRMTSKFLSEDVQENQKIGVFFEQIASTLEEISEYYKKGEIPHGSCGKLEFYSNEIRSLIGHVVGDQKARKLQDKLMCALYIEHQLHIMENKSELGIIDQAAGYFKAFADTIKNLPYPNYEKYRQIKEKIIKSRDFNLIDVLRSDEVFLIEYLLNDEKFNKLNSYLNKIIKNDEKG